MIEEIRDIESKGIDPSTIVISDRAHVVMPYHAEFDRLEEERRGDNAIGTTNKGIGPAYKDKVERSGIRIGELLNIEYLALRLPGIIEAKNEVLTKIYGADPIDVNDILEQVRSWAPELSPFIRPVDDLVATAIENGENVILEGAQGALLDIDHGTYPYVTSSNPTIGGPMTGMGLGPNAFGGVAGVFKAYCTRVGAGPFPTELKEGIGPQIKEIASEFGVTTGRERRVGWFDGVAGRYSARVNGFDSVIITRLDILDNFDSINVCVAYELNGERIEKFPVDAEQLERCKPIYETLEGWSGTTAGVTDADDLPPEARAYVAFLESVLEVSAAIISTGPRRDETITIKPVIPV